MVELLFITLGLLLALITRRGKRVRRTRRISRALRTGLRNEFRPLL